MAKQHEKPDDSRKRKLEDKVRPVVDEALHKVMGITIDEMSRDITEKLNRSPLLDFEIDTSQGFRKAKKKFVKSYLQKLLKINYGNISEVARIADIDRRSVHRMIRESSIDVERIRKEMARAYEIRQSAVNAIIEDVIDNYKTFIHPGKLDEVYRNVSEFSKDILDVLPEKPPSLREAEERFERELIRKALAENNGNVSRTARKLGMRYETLHRKMKRLGL